MAETIQTNSSSETIAFQRERIASTPSDSQAWTADTNRPADTDQSGGYGMADESERPSDFPHKGGDPLGDGNAQYGASPLRSARYDEDHKVNDRHFADGKPQVQPAMHTGPARDADQ